VSPGEVRAPQDQLTSAALRALEPGSEQVRRMESVVSGRLQGSPRSLAAEWLDLFLGGPLRNGAWVLAAAAVLFLTTPAGLALTAWARLGAPARTALAAGRPATVETKGLAPGRPATVGTKGLEAGGNVAVSRPDGTWRVHGRAITPGSVRARW
jgi:hypothetical protein